METIRRIDPLGRITIPAQMRQTWGEDYGKECYVTLTQENEFTLTIRYWQVNSVIHSHKS